MNSAADAMASTSCIESRGPMLFKYDSYTRRGTQSLSMKNKSSFYWNLGYLSSKGTAPVFTNL